MGERPAGPEQRPFPPRCRDGERDQGSSLEVPGREKSPDDTVPVEVDQEEVAQLLSSRRLLAIPVVDSEGHMQGIIAADDVLDVVREEATEDIHKIGGVEALDLPYFLTAPLAMLRKRAGWLSILFVGEMLTATAMGFFQDEIATA